MSTIHQKTLTDSIGGNSSLPTFWKLALKHFRELDFNRKICTREGVLGEPIWHNLFREAPRVHHLYKNKWESIQTVVTHNLINPDTQSIYTQAECALFLPDREWFRHNNKYLKTSSFLASWTNIEIWANNTLMGDHPTYASALLKPNPTQDENEYERDLDPPFDPDNLDDATFYTTPQSEYLAQIGDSWFKINLNILGEPYNIGQTNAPLEGASLSTPLRWTGAAWGPQRLGSASEGEAGEARAQPQPPLPPELASRSLQGSCCG